MEDERRGIHPAAVDINGRRRKMFDSFESRPVDQMRSHEGCFNKSLADYELFQDSMSFITGQVMESAV